MQFISSFRTFSLAIVTCLGLLVTTCGSKQKGSPEDDIIPDTTVTVNNVGLTLIADSLTSPVTMTEAPDNSGRLFIVDQTGLIWIVQSDRRLHPEPFLDLRDQIVNLKKEHEERGLLGLAFHPDYENNGRFFVYYSAPLREEAPTGWDHTSHISEFRVSEDNPNAADPKSQQVLMYIDQPQNNHNAGTLTFGPDQYLYISLGDGGGANDNEQGHVPDWYEDNTGGNGQDIGNNLLGSILRIDVNGEPPYGIPEDNPFTGGDGMDEIFAYGLRNPYRISFDMGGDSELFAGDAGQELWEEIDIIKKGNNYGWDVKEATHCFNAANNERPLNSCPDTDSLGNILQSPVIELKTGNLKDGGRGLVIIGGYVYRGKSIPRLDGRYIFGVWTQQHGQPQGAVFVADRKQEGLWDFNRLDIARNGKASLNHFVLGFGQDNDGEIYLLTTDEAGPVGNTGRVYRMASR